MEADKITLARQKTLRFLIFGLSLGTVMIIILSLLYFMQSSELSKLKSYKESLEAQEAELLNKTRENNEFEAVQKTTPEGFVEYRNVELKFSFSYPEEWGSLNFKPEENRRIIGEFSKNNDMKVRLFKKDMPLLVGHDDPTSNLFGYRFEDGKFWLLGVDSNKELSASEVLKASVITGSEYLLYQSKGLGYYFQGMAKLNNNAAYDSVIIDSTKGRLEPPYTPTDSEVVILDKVLHTFESQ